MGNNAAPNLPVHRLRWQSSNLQWHCRSRRIRVSRSDDGQPSSPTSLSFPSQIVGGTTDQPHSRLRSRIPARPRCKSAAFQQAEAFRKRTLAKPRMASQPDKLAKSMLNFRLRPRAPVRTIARHRQHCKSFKLLAERHGHRQFVRFRRQLYRDRRHHARDLECKLRRGRLSTSRMVRKALPSYDPSFARPEPVELDLGRRHKRSAGVADSGGSGRHRCNLVQR